MKLNQLLDVLEKRGIGEALLRGGEPMQTRVEGEWRPQGAATPVGALGAMLESGAPPEAQAQWRNDDRCQFEQNGYLIKAARKGDRVQIAVKRAVASASPFTASSDGNASSNGNASGDGNATDNGDGNATDNGVSQTVFAPTSSAVPVAAPVAAKASLQPVTVDWYYLDEGVEKGPVAPDRLRVLIGMDAIGGDTLVWSDGMSDWKPARDSDLRSMLPAAALNATPQAAPLAPGASVAPIADPSGANGKRLNQRYDVSTTGEEVDLEERRNKGASWFYWIVGLTLINTIILQSGWDFNFWLGATVSVFADAFAAASGSASARILSLGFDVIVIGFYAMCGVMSYRGASWAFILGLVFFALDTILLVLLLQPIGILIHGWALYCIFSGLMANNNLQRLQREKAITGFPVAN